MPVPYNDTSVDASFFLTNRPSTINRPTVIIPKPRKDLHPGVSPRKNTPSISAVRGIKKVTKRRFVAPTLTNSLKYIRYARAVLNREILIIDNQVVV
jgi:hypothetical protein